MATETEGIIIPIKLESSQLKSELKTSMNDVDAFVNDIKKSFESLNKAAVFKMNKKDLEKSIGEIQSQLNSLNNNKLKLSAEIETGDIKKQLDFIDEQTKKLQEKLTFQMEVKETKNKSLKTLNKEIKEIENQLKKKNQLLIETSNTKTFKDTKKEINELEKQLKDLEKTRELKLEINKQSYNEITEAFGSVKKLAIAAGVGVGAIGASLVASTKQAMDFETQFAEVRTLISDMPESGLEGLKQGIIDLSYQTGILSNESIPAMYSAISASVPADNVVAFLETASKNAIGGVTDLQTSVDGLTTILNAYNKDTSEVVNVSDLMFETMKAGKTTIGELSHSYFNVVPIAASVGVAFEDISAAMATITAQGTPTSVATTQLRQLIVELSDEGSQAGKTFQQLAGQTFRDFIRSGKNLQDALKLMEKQAKSTNVGLSNLFGSIEAGQSALGLTGENTARFTKDLQTMANAAGATQNAFDKISETPAMRIKKIQASFSALTLELGKSLLPTAETLIEIVEKNLPKITQAIKSVGNVIVGLVKNAKILLPIVVGLGTGFVALKVALLLTAPAGISVAGAIGTITKAMITLNASTGGLIIAIGLIASALVGLITHFEKVLMWFDKFGEAIGLLSSQIRNLQRETKRLIDDFEAQKESIKAESEEMDRLTQRYKELQAIQKRTAGQEAEFENVWLSLKKLNPEIEKYMSFKDEINEETNANAVIGKNERVGIESAEAISNNAYKEYLKHKEEAVRIEEELNRLKEQGVEAGKRVLKLEEDKKKAIEKANENYEQYLEYQKIAQDLNKSTERKKPLSYSSEVSSDATATATAEGTGKGKKKEADPFETLKKKWEALKEVHSATINDEKELKEQLIKDDNEYYNAVIDLATTTYRTLKAEGKDKTDSEIAYLDLLIEKIKDAKERLGGDKPKTFLDELGEHWQELVAGAQNAVNSIANLFNSLWENQINAIEDSLDTQLELIDKNLEEQNALYDAEIEKTKARQEEREGIISDTQDRIAEINEQIGEHMTEEEYKRLMEQRDALEEKLQDEQTALSAEEAYIQQLEEEKAKREEEAEALKEKAEKEAAIKTAQLKRKQAIMDKATGIMNATISLATGIAAAAASGSQYGVAAPVMIPFIVSMMIAAAAAQIGTIASTPLPQIPSFSTGGYVPTGNEQYYSGLVGSSGNSEDKTLVWASEGERILNHNETKQWEYYQSRELQTVNTTNNSPTINVGGVTINAGATTDPKKLASISGKEIARAVVQSITRGYT